MSHRRSYGHVTRSWQEFTTDQIEADRTMRAASPPAGYSGTTAAKIVGISYRQLDYWARTDLVRPSLSDAAGSGSRRSYSYRDLLELRVIKSLLDAGIKLESVRVAFEYLREHVETDIASAHLVISGSDVLLCDGDELIDVMRRGGQGVLNVLAIGGVKSDLDAQLAGPGPVAGSVTAVAVAL
jgi:DNA-binding transcriptional MerR regulator